MELPCKEGLKQPLGANNNATPIHSQKARPRQSAEEGFLERYNAVVQQCMEPGRDQMFDKNDQMFDKKPTVYADKKI